jgi:CubicO group peptidase (beta-lactamase class C family)
LESCLTPNGYNYNAEYWDEENPPGTNGAYANINFDLIGYLVEIISDEPLYEYCKNHIFEPLDMVDTSFNLSDYSTDELANPYIWDDEANGYISNHNVVHIHYPAGGLFSSVVDMSHFMIAHMNGGMYNGTQILKETTISEMHKIQSNRYGLGYGLAWLSESRSLQLGTNILYFPNLVYGGHGGAVTSGLHTYMYMKISSDTAILLFTNSNSFIYPIGWNGLQILRELLFIKANSL